MERGLDIEDRNMEVKKEQSGGICIMSLRNKRTHWRRVAISTANWGNEGKILWLDNEVQTIKTILEGECI